MFAGSGDWMYRNFAKRIEVTFPIEDKKINHRNINEILPLYLKDNVKAHELQPDGTYVQLKPGGEGEATRSQTQFISIIKATTKDKQGKSRASDIKLRVIESPKENESAA